MESGKNLFMTAEAPTGSESLQWKQSFSAKNAGLAMVIVSQIYVTSAKLFFY